MKCTIFSFLILSFAFSVCRGQDAQFTQFYAAPLFLSPSFAGSAGNPRVIMNLRDQWSKLPGDFLTYSVSADNYIEKYSSGVGVLLVRDQAGGGLVNTTSAGFNYSYSFNVTSKWRFTPGLQVYYYSRNIDYTRLVFSDQISRDNISPVSVEMERLVLIKPVRHMDITSSFLAYSDNVWTGFSLDHMASLNKALVIEEGYMPVRFNLHAGGKHYISGQRFRNGSAGKHHGEESVTGAFNFTWQGRFKYIDFGAFYTKSPLQLGLWYRGLPVFSDNPNTGAITVQVGYRMGNVVMGYSYDYTISRLITRTGGAHEVSMMYELRSPVHKKRIRMVPCPSFLE